MEKLPQIRKLGIDLTGKDMIKEPFPNKTRYALHHGWNKNGVDGMTNIPGIYAAGECANVSVQGE
ncbi:MAG: hypothetical protein CM1200mP15_05300 [Dehalococcoidia bacterium]|nr:MAG: hypothetical protein CM1200mP15_05300 [Dehalococcoidia bacterium]